jgi:hypothetical protein
MQDVLARSVTMEQGKTLSDAKGDVFRGLGGLCMPCHVMSCGVGRMQKVLL